MCDNNISNVGCGCAATLFIFLLHLLCFAPVIWLLFFDGCDRLVPVIVDGKANNEITGRHEMYARYRVVLTFESTGCDSIVYNTIKIGDTLSVYNISSVYWQSDPRCERCQRKISPNNGKNIRYINNKSIPQLKEYERYKKQQAKATARSNTGR